MTRHTPLLLALTLCTALTACQTATLDEFCFTAPLRAGNPVSVTGARSECASGGSIDVIDGECLVTVEGDTIFLEGQLQYVSTGPSFTPDCTGFNRNFSCESGTVLGAGTFTVQIRSGDNLLDAIEVEVDDTGDKEGSCFGGDDW